MFLYGRLRLSLVRSVKELLIVLGIVAGIVAIEWVSNELAKESNWFIALTFFSVFTYFLIKGIKESKK